MSDEISKRDENRNTVVMGVTNDADLFVTQLRVDPTTKRLLVNVTGADGAILDGVTATIKATVLDYTNSNPVAVRLTDTTGDYVSVGAGTQYADGAVRGTATGTLAMGDDGTNIQSVHTDSSGDLQVDVLTLPSITGTVTANAGTNLWKQHYQQLTQN